MHQHTVRTALTLYRAGTYTLETAARQAGRSPARFRDELVRRGIDVPEYEPSVRKRARVAAD